VLRRSDAQSALGILRKMQQRQAETNIFHYSAGITACEKASSWPSALDLLRGLPVRAVRGDAIASNAAISALAKGGQWASALQLVGSEADTISYNATISACSVSRWQHALFLARGMGANSVSSSTITANSIINVLSWRRALDILAAVPCSARSLVTYNSTITACEGAAFCPAMPYAAPANADWPVALSLLQSMFFLQAVPDVVSFNSAVSASEKGCQWELPLYLLRKGLDVVGFTGAISGCSQAAYWEMATLLFFAMPAQLVEPNIFSRNAVACHWRLASELRRGGSADVVSYNALLSYPRPWTSSMWLLVAMAQALLQPNLLTYSSALLALKGRWCHGLSIFKDMEGHVHQDTISFNSMLGARPAWQAAWSLLGSLSAHRLSPTAVSYGCAIGSCEAADTAACWDVVGSQICPR
ncbi:unnamed protein product, partial [Effrenium voratum]